MQISTIIKTTLNNNNIYPDDEQLTKLRKFYDLVIEYNKSINLTAITDPVEFACKHFADSLLNYTHFNQNATLCDIGTGAGFPGIPLKIMRPDLQITLVDSLNKRINFLNIVITELKLTNITTIHSRAQELPLHNVSRETFDYVVSRAVAQLNILSELCLPYVAIGGEMIAYKSTNYQNELENSQNALSILGGKLVQNFSINLIDLNNNTIPRNLLIIKKQNSTPDLYPRGKNKILSKPL